MLFFRSVLLSLILLLSQVPYVRAVETVDYIPVLPGFQPHPGRIRAPRAPTLPKTPSTKKSEATDSKSLSNFGWGEIEAKLVDSAVSHISSTSKAEVVDYYDDKSLVQKRRKTSPTSGVIIQFSSPNSKNNSKAENSSTLPTNVLQKKADRLTVSSFPDGLSNREFEELTAVTLQFSEPMVSSAEVAQPFVEKSPARLSPSVDGRWRWIDRKTLVFEISKGYFPLGNRYNLSVPTGTRAVSGRVLKDAYKISFDTLSPQPQIGTVMPQRQLSVSFRMPIDPATLSGKVSCRLNGESWPVRLGTPQENLATFKDTRDRHFVLVSERPFPDGSIEFEVQVEPGIRTRGGTLPSSQVKQSVKLPYSSAFMDLVEEQQGLTLIPSVPHTNLPPGSDLMVAFSQEIGDKVDKSLVTVSPEIPGMRIFRQGRNLILRGATKPDTEYAITIKRGFEGITRRLQRTATVRRTISSYEPSLLTPASSYFVQGLGRQAIFSVSTRNLKKFLVRAYEFEPSRMNYIGSPAVQIPRNKPALLEKTVSVVGPENEIVRTPVDLSELVKGKSSQLVIKVEAIEPGHSGPNLQRMGKRSFTCLVQFTNLSLFVWPADSGYLCRVVDSNTKRPLAGVEVSMVPGGHVATTDDGGFAELNITPDSVGGVIAATYKGDCLMLYPGSAPIFGSSLEPFNWYSHIATHDLDVGLNSTFWGWLKRVDQARIDLNSNLTMELIDSQNRSFGMREIEFTKKGAFKGEVSIPDGFAHGFGKAVLRYAVQGKVLSEHDVQFYVGKPEWTKLEDRTTWSLNLSSTRSASSGDDITATVVVLDADGAPCRELDVKWKVLTHPVDFAPPGWEGYSFSQVDGRPGWEIPEHQAKELATKTDRNGKSALRAVVPSSLKNSSPIHMEFLVSPNGGIPKAKSVVTAHSVDEYAGLKVKRRLFRDHQEISVSSIVAAIDGTLRAGEDVKITVRPREPFPERLNARATGASVCEKHVSSENNPISTKFSTSYLGPVEVFAELSKTGLAASRSLGLSTRRETSDGEWKIFTDKDFYEHNDLCTVFVKAPVDEADGLILLNCDGEFIRSRIQIKNKIGQISFPVSGSVYGIFCGAVKLWTRCTRVTDKADSRSKVRPGSGFDSSSGLVSGSSSTSSGSNKRSNLIVSDIEPVTLPLQLSVRPSEPSLRFKLLSNEKPIVCGHGARMKVQICWLDGTPASGIETVMRISPRESENLPSDKSTLYVPRNLLPSNCPDSSTSNLYSHLGLESEGDLHLRERPRVYSHGVITHCGMPSMSPRLMCADYISVQSPLNGGDESGILTSDENGIVECEIQIPQGAGEYLFVVESSDGIRASGMASFPVRVVTPAEVSVTAPEFISDMDEFNVLISIDNNGTHVLKPTLEISSPSKRFTEQRRVISAEPGRTTVKITGLGDVGSEGILFSLRGEGLVWSKSIKPEIVDLRLSEEVSRIGIYDGERENLRLSKKSGVVSQLDLIVSNGVAGTLTSIARLLCGSEPDTFESRSARAIALSSFKSDLAKEVSSARLDTMSKTLSNDITTISNGVGQNGEWTTWLPDGGRGNFSSHREQIHFVYGCDALVAGREVGLIPVEDGLPSAADYLTLLDYESREKNKRSPGRRRALAKYVASRAARHISDESSKRVATALNDYLSKNPISCMDSDEISLFLMSSRQLELTSAHKSELERKFSEVVKTIAKETDSLPPSLDSFQKATIFLALSEQCKLNHSELLALHRLAVDQEKSLLRVGRNMQFEQALSFRGMCHYAAKYQDRASQGVSRFKSDRAGWIEEFSLGDCKVQTKSIGEPEVPRTANWQLSPGLRYGLRATLTRPVAEFQGINSGIAIRREFFSASPESKLWKDSHGVYHCKLGSRIGVRLRVVPSKVIHLVRATDHFAGGFVLDTPIPTGTGSSPYPFEDPPMWEIYHDWVHRIDFQGSQAVLYSESMGPTLYNYEYFLRASTPGKYFVPPASIKELATFSLQGNSKPDQFVIHE